MKKRIDLNKIGVIVLSTFIFGTLTLGVLYNYFCKEQIAVRERHLAAVYQELMPPKNAELIEETSYGKQFSRAYFIDYKCDDPKDTVMNHYRMQFKEQGYVLTQTRNEITAHKNGVIVSVRVEKNEIHMHIRFDDIFQKLSI